MARYDFAFEQFFACRHPVRWEGVIRAVARMGAANDYAQRYADLLQQRIQLIHTPAEYEITSNLQNWYPRLDDLTPRSAWFEKPPSIEEIEEQFGWPVFIKGERQTSKHQRDLSIIEGAEQYKRAIEAWEIDPILRWQKIVCREFVKLRLVGEQSPNVLPRSFEFRSFWWRNECLAIGPYWMDEHYQLTLAERQSAIGVAHEAARRLDVTFLVVDVAQTAAGNWIVIECNDGQDSGYAGVAPMLMWRRVIDCIAGKT